MHLLILVVVFEGAHLRTVVFQIMEIISMVIHIVVTSITSITMTTTTMQVEIIRSITMDMEETAIIGEMMSVGKLILIFG